MPYITDFKVIRPAFEHSQEKILHWVAKAHQKAHSFSNEDSSEFHAALLQKLLAIGTGKKKIEKRGTVVPDLQHEDFSAMEIYQVTPSTQEGKDLQVRSDFFEQCADDVVQRFYNESPLADHLVQVTCTGYVSPSAIQKIASQKKGDSTTVTHVFHMGCYASIPAIRIGFGMLKGNETTDIIHTEMCSLHMNPSLHDTEQLVVQTLFADGFIKYTLSNQAGRGYELLSLHEVLIHESIQTMSWKQKSWGMKMHIAKTVPILIRRELKGFIQTLFDKAGIPFQECVYAIHPGGPKIIDEVAKELSLSDEQIHHSAEILRDYGNMSSATLPHIWNAILQDPSVKDATLVVSLAFGPGLTVAGSLMKKTGGV